MLTFGIVFLILASCFLIVPFLFDQQSRSKLKRSLGVGCLIALVCTLLSLVTKNWAIAAYGSGYFGALCLAVGGFLSSRYLRQWLGHAHFFALIGLPNFFVGLIFFYKLS
ncbi:hypothetical protein EDM56_15495 [Brevibacillus fluminis]|uniref:Uncharacterized protein n=1 Tax=Brevibacillus fluminis TaxID=511487 RepID=A0A3M8DIZ5_9BACL|nr:hypothetical protein [Brevibacillus fluminis]RNB87097.1 hypothetical protein EDM56_15495 [Brevibacillus fluminis]